MVYQLKYPSCGAKRTLIIAVIIAYDPQEQATNLQMEWMRGFESNKYEHGP
jgi:hypothetical protein